MEHAKHVRAGLHQEAPGDAKTPRPGGYDRNGRHRLYELFGVAGAATDPHDALFICIEGEGRRCALMVDELLGQQQVVITSLGQSMGRIPGVSGGSILGDGRVGLILDAGGILKLTARRTAA
ncbi:MAG: chemotaxis protein CheW [Phycisphaerae bacterium]|nr:chemotaxis protein CheW [Phycisphaerae bacterium]